MNTSLSRKPVGALWPNEALHGGKNNAMAIAIAAALAIEVALVAAVLSVHVPTAAPTRPAPVMQIRFAKPDTPPPPPPVIKKVVKQESELPKPTHVARPAAPTPHHVPTPLTPPVPVATQDSPAPTQAVPSAAPPAASPATALGPTTAAPAQPADIAIVCPVQVKPEMPARAVAEGIVGSVTARATLRGSKVVRVDIMQSTPPGVFDAAVRRAMSQYQCKVDGSDDVVVEQSFDFAETD